MSLQALIGMQAYLTPKPPSKDPLSDAIVAAIAESTECPVPTVDGELGCASCLQMSYRIRRRVLEVIKREAISSLADALDDDQREGVRVLLKRFGLTLREPEAEEPEESPEVQASFAAMAVYDRAKASRS